MNNHSVIPKFLICWLAVTEKGRNTELLRLRGCMWVYYVAKEIPLGLYY